MNRNHSKVFIAATVAIMVFGATARASETDERIESSAKQSYVFKTYLKDDAISTYSKDGVVTLKGTIKEYSHKSLAQETVASLPGVKSVDNQLEYKGEYPSENSDAWLSMQIKYSLFYNRNVSAMNTQVYVVDGIATLRGNADSQAQKDLAGEYAKDVKGIKDVKNDMVVVPVTNPAVKTKSEQMDDASITAQVRTAFLYHHSTSAFKTGVETNNGVVTLTGVTSSSAAKDMASKVANDVDGVNSVINNMTIDEALMKN